MAKKLQNQTAVAVSYTTDAELDAFEAAFKQKVAEAQAKSQAVTVKLSKEQRLAQYRSISIRVPYRGQDARYIRVEIAGKAFQIAHKVATHAAKQGDQEVVLSISPKYFLHREAQEFSGLKGYTRASINYQEVA